MKQLLSVTDGSGNAADFGFLPGNDPQANVCALQRAVLSGGTVRVELPGIYDLNGTVELGDDTALVFGAGVYLRKQFPADRAGYYVFLNRGARTRTFNRNIRIEGAKIICNGVDMKGRIPGLRGQLSFFYVKNLVIRDFECLDLGAVGFGIQVCTFENVLIENVRIEGLKDAVHFGRGSKFVVRHGLFRTFDDPIALNAYDYADSNPQFGWIEDGLIEDCYDLDQAETTGFFCRMLAGAWGDWFEGMEIQNSDLVVSGGRLYCAHMKPDGAVFKSRIPPTHAEGVVELDGISWRVAQDDYEYQCACRNIHFRTVFLQKKRPQAFRLHFGNNRYSRSIYPGASFPVQQNIILENIVCCKEVPFLLTGNTPADSIKILNSNLHGNAIEFETLDCVPGEYPALHLLLSGTTFQGDSPSLVSCAPGRQVILKISDSIPLTPGMECKTEGNVKIAASDIPVNTQKKKRHTASASMGNAFTIVELLITVSIISILACLLLPALHSAKMKAKAIQCVSQQNQVMKGSMLYADDNKGCIPIATPNAGSYLSFPAFYYSSRGQRYVKRSFLQCPSDPAPVKDFSLASYSHTYGMYQPYVELSAAMQKRKEISGVYWYSIGGLTSNSGYILYKAKAPSATPSYADVYRTDSKVTAWQYTGSQKRETGAVYFPHQLRSGMAFLDGHSGTVSPAELRARYFITMMNLPPY